MFNAAPDRFSALGSAVATTSALQSMEPERYAYTIGGIDISYLRGYRDAINHLYDQHAQAKGMESALSIDQGSGNLSWGLQATGVGMSRYTGRSVRSAVLDTGPDLAHPDIIGRAIETRSFVEGQSVQDPDRFSPALEDAKRAGMTIDRRFEDVGVASGSIDLDRLPLLRRIEGAHDRERPRRRPSPATRSLESVRLTLKRRFNVSL